MDENKELTESELFSLALKDLVKLATLANNVVVQGQFSGAIADEVNELLSMCRHIHNTFVEDSDG